MDEKLTEQEDACAAQLENPQPLEESDVSSDIELAKETAVEEIEETMEMVDEEAQDAEKAEEQEVLAVEAEKEKAAMRKERRDNIGFYSILAALVLGSLIFRGYWKNSFEGVVVDGASMNQTLQNGDELLMKKLKSADDLKRGDVIVVKVSGYEEFKGSNTEYLIKRLIAIEGDKVRCTDGQIEICYAGTTEYVLLEETYAYYRSIEDYDFEEYMVGEDEIFFLGDNRQNSMDSRYKEGDSRLEDRLYKEEDVYGVVSQWAIDNRSWLEKILFWRK